MNKKRLRVVGLAGGSFGRRSSFLGWLLRQNAGSFDRASCESVVQEVRAAGLVPGETKEFRLDDRSDPRSLRLRRPGELVRRGDGAGSVWAEMTTDGRLMVVIETRDLGHAGEYGFAYSDAPLNSGPIGGPWQPLALPGHLRLGLPRMRIDDHWSEVAYNLD